jgi:hypothetical protein
MLYVSKGKTLNKILCKCNKYNRLQILIVMLILFIRITEYNMHIKYEFNK